MHFFHWMPETNRFSLFPHNSLFTLYKVLTPLKTGIFKPILIYRLLQCHKIEYFPRCARKVRTCLSGWYLGGYWGVSGGFLYIKPIYCLNTA